jgi:glycosyltransferase involved in cell wall biosynthesis
VHIALVAPPWLSVPPKGYGGIEWIVSLLADGLVELGHDVTLFATGDSTTKARLEYAFEEAPGPQRINDLWYDAIHTLHVFREPARFDLFHVHTAWSGLLVPASLGMPVVHTIHGALTPETSRLYSELGDRVRFVAISENQRSHMPAGAPADVVYNGIDAARYPFREDKDDFLLFLGRASPDKGVLRAVSAARKSDRPLVIVAKVASADEEEYWQEHVLPALPSNATVLGEIGHAEKTDLLARAAAVLFPIDWDEPFGLVMAEAMACGTPVIATPRGSVPEIIVDGETGFIVPVETYPEEAAAHLKELDRIDPKACRRRVEERFSKEAMVAGYARTFASLLADGVPD